jgi:hypothetical protein
MPRLRLTLLDAATLALNAAQAREPIVSATKLTFGEASRSPT